MNNISITWYGHSCFLISCEGFSIVLDPYAPGSVPGFDGLAPHSLNACQVLCSHEHKDHGFTEAVALSDYKGESPFKILKIDTWHDDANGTLRGANRIHILEAAGIKIAHMGDLGCSLTPEQAECLKNLDAILVPVGGYYTINAAQAKELVSALSPRVVIPMHYRTDTFGYPVIGRLEEYTDLCKDVVRYDTDTIVIGKDTRPQTAVLTPRT